jgi:hypothetical protein
MNPNFIDAIGSWNKVSGGPTLSKTGSISLSNNFMGAKSDFWKNLDYI